MPDEPREKLVVSPTMFAQLLKEDPTAGEWAEAWGREEEEADGVN